MSLYYAKEGSKILSRSYLCFSLFLSLYQKGIKQTNKKYVLKERHDLDFLY